jgi:hypothetical protein
MLRHVVLLSFLLNAYVAHAEVLKWTWRQRVENTWMRCGSHYTSEKLISDGKFLPEHSGWTAGETTHWKVRGWVAEVTSHDDVLMW